MKEKRTINGRKGLIAAVALVLLLCAAVGGTLAWLTTQTDPVVNTFTAAQVGTDIKEYTEDGQKSNIRVKNTGDIDAYVRTAVAMTWVDSEGNPVAAELPALPTTLGENWVLGSDGHYYYTKPVAAGVETAAPIFVVPITETDPPDGCHLQVTILAEAIQSTPSNAVTEAWKPVTSVDSNGTLTVTAKESQ